MADAASQDVSVFCGGPGVPWPRDATGLAIEFMTIGLCWNSASLHFPLNDQVGSLPSSSESRPASPFAAGSFRRNAGAACRTPATACGGVSAALPAALASWRRSRPAWKRRAVSSRLIWYRRRARLVFFRALPHADARRIRPPAPHGRRRGSPGGSAAPRPPVRPRNGAPVRAADRCRTGRRCG